jgi:hypothetical protein
MQQHQGCAFPFPDVVDHKLGGLDFPVGENGLSGGPCGKSWNANRTPLNAVRGRLKWKTYN